MSDELEEIEWRDKQAANAFVANARDSGQLIYDVLNKDVPYLLERVRKAEAQVKEMRKGMKYAHALLSWWLYDEVPGTREIATEDWLWAWRKKDLQEETDEEEEG